MKNYLIRFILLIALAAPCFLLAPPAAADTATIQPSSADTYLREDQATNNYGTDTTMFVQSRNSNRNRRSLVQFSLSAIPSGSVITSATLELFMTAAPSAGRTHNVHRVTRSWVETQATWNRAATGTNWTTSGGDFVAAPTTSTTTGTIANVWLSWDVTSDVSAWYAGTASNYGFLVKDSSESSATNYSATFATLNNATAANRPRLVVTYTPPDLQISSMTVDASVVNGDTVTVTMTVLNNGPAAVSDVTPSALTSSGTATAALASGPTPASVAILNSGESTSFTWTYTITGSSGQTYAFTGNATANGGAISSPSVATNTGSIGTYSVVVSPPSVVAGSTAVQLSFTVTNGLTSGTVDRVTINSPNTTVWDTNATWGDNDTSGWIPSAPDGTDGPRYRFDDDPAISDDIPAAGGSKTFTVTFALIGNPGADTIYTFPVDVRRRGGGTTTLNVLVTVRVPKLQVTSMAVDPSVVSGGTVTVVMTVMNIGSVTLTDVTPSALTTGGTATKVLASGPTPASAASLESDASTTFEWTYTITGSVGQTYNFTGNATANGGSVTATNATSNTGSIASYGVSVSPSSVTAGSTNVQLAFTVTNNLTSGTLDRVTVTNPNTSIWQSNGTWGNNDGSGWTQALLSSPTRYQFTSPAAGSDILANGGTKTFTVTFTLVADPGSDTDYTFPVAVRRRGGATTNLTVTVSVTKYVLTLKSVSPATIDADGVSTSRVTVTLTKSGVGQSGQTINFTTNAGTFTAGGTSTAVNTDASGDAYVDLRASASSTDVTATVNASFLSSASTSGTVSFRGITFTLTPATATVDADGQSTAALTLTFRYTTGGTVISGATATVSATSGSVSPTSPASSASTIAVTYTAPALSSDGSATATATYRGFTASSTITLRGITFTLTPASATVDADGQSTAALTLTFRYTTGGTAISGATATVSATSGSVSPTSPASSASPIAVTYTAPALSSDSSATVNASYKGLSASSTITLRGITFTLTPASATVDADGQSTVSLTLRLRYASGGAITGASTTVSLSGQGSLSPTGTVNSSASDIALTYTAPASSSNGSSTITVAAYKGFSALTSAITYRAVVLSISASPGSITADGVTTSTITATLAVGGSAASGRTVSFSATAGTLSSGSATTNGSGQAIVTLTSSASKTNVTSTVTGTYSSLSQQATVTFTGITISEVGYLSGNAGNGGVTLNWANPSQYFTGLLIIRKSGSAPTGVPSDGTSYSVGNPVGDATVVYNGVSTSLSQSGLTNGTGYYYKAYGYYATARLYSGGTSLDLSPSAGGAGEPEWSYGLAGGSLMNGATPDYSGNLYQSAGTTRLVGVTQSGGDQLWAPVTAQGVLTGGVTWVPVSGSGFATNYLLAGDQTGRLYAVNAASGADVWAPVSLPGAEAIEAAPVVQLGGYGNAAFQAQYGATTDVVFAVSKNTSTTNNRVYAVRLSDGALLWQFNETGTYQMDGSLGGAWIDYGRNQLYVVTRAGAGGGQASLWSLNSLTGALVGSLTLGHIEAAPMQSYLDETTLYVGTTGGDLEAIDVSGGAPVRKWTGPAALGSGLVAGSLWEDYTQAGRLYLTTQNGFVWALDDPGAGPPPNPASPVWKTAIAGASAPMVMDETTLYVGSSDGKLYELGLTDGVVVKQVTVGNGGAAVGTPSASSATTLYVGTSTGKLFRYALPLP